MDTKQKQRFEELSAKGVTELTKEEHEEFRNLCANQTCPECGEEFFNTVDNECPKCGHGKKEETFILLKWDARRGQHHQVILNKSLQQPKKTVVYLHEGMRMQKTYEEEQEGGAN